MRAKYVHQLIVRKPAHQRAIHDRNARGTGPAGKPLGWMRGKEGEWFVQLPGGIDLPAFPTQQEALKDMIEIYQKGLPE